jgi:tetraacyldisaccharide 4'-kinase
MTCCTIFIDSNIISYNNIVKFDYNVNIKKFVVRLVSLGKPKIPTRKDFFTILWYILRYMLFVFLYALSLVYRGVVQLRIALYRTGIFNHYALPCPIISIGNITTGGTGKTPMVILVTQILRQHGKRVAILSRGYRRHGFPCTANVLVCDGGASETLAVQLVGDEPLLIARKFHQQSAARLPDVVVIVGKQRYLAGKFAIERFQPDVLLLDDGFQYLQLERTCDLVLIDATSPFGGEYLLPAGFLREPLENLARAHAFMITRSDEVADISPIRQRLHQINPNSPIFTGSHICDGLKKAGTDEQLAIETLKGQRLLGVSGLANPASFHRLLTQLGLTIAKFLDFPDHHWYTEQDAHTIRRIISEHHIDALMTTEKDETKLSLHSDMLDVPIYVMTITIEVQPKKEFENFVLNIGAQP